MGRAVVRSTRRRCTQIGNLATRRMIRAVGDRAASERWCLVTPSPKSRPSGEGANDAVVRIVLSSAATSSRVPDGAPSRWGNVGTIRQRRYRSKFALGLFGELSRHRLTPPRGPGQVLRIGSNRYAWVAVPRRQLCCRTNHGDRRRVWNPPRLHLSAPIGGSGGHVVTGPVHPRKQRSSAGPCVEASVSRMIHFALLRTTGPHYDRPLARRTGEAGE